MMVSTPKPISDNPTLTQRIDWTVEHLKKLDCRCDTDVGHVCETCSEIAMWLECKRKMKQLEQQNQYLLFSFDSIGNAMRAMTQTAMGHAEQIAKRIQP